MEDDTVRFSHVNKEVVEENRERIERLFGARLRLQDDGEGLCSCQILCQSDNAPEVLVKAKSYLAALTGEGAGFSITTEKFNLHEVNMIVQNKDEIERASTTVLLASPLSNNVRLQGQLNDILLAKNIINTLLAQNPATAAKSNNPSSASRSNLSGQSSNERNGGSSSAGDDGVKSSSAGKIRAKTGLSRTKSQNRATDLAETTAAENSKRSFGSGEEERTMLQTDRTNSGTGEAWMTDKYIQEHFDNLGIDATVSQFKQSAESDSSDSSDGEESYGEIQKQPDYKSKVEFAFKLGYQEDDLLEALRKVGNHASQNELLSELIKQGTSSGEVEGGDLDGSLLLSLDSEQDLLDLGIHQRWSNSDKAGNNLRHIIIDGSNVAMSHGNKEMFSCMGIKLAVDWFKSRGHSDITVFVPQWRKETSRTDARIKDQAILNQLEKEKILVYTPARRIGGKRVVCYDDRYILKLAAETDGIVVSNDNYRDLMGEKEEFKKVIEERLLMYSFVNDRFMPPDDPLGRNGPTLDNFLLLQPLEPEPLPPPCPYGSKKCTYGNKCKYYHPERRNQPHKTVTEKLAEQARLRMIERDRSAQQAAAGDGKKKLGSRKSLSRTTSLNTSELGGQNTARNLQEQISGSVSNLDKADEYNQRLTESLRKMELDIARKETHSPDRKSEFSRRGSGYSERQTGSRGSEYSERQSSPRWTGLDNFNNKPGMVSPRESSPVNLAVPGHGPSLDNGEQFVCGHLALAKKLSDEASESDKLKNKEKMHDAGRNSPGSGQQFQRMGGLGEHSPNSKKSKQKQPVMKQKLSRQLSLQGSEDPRLRQEHTALRTQYSFDPRLAPNTQFQTDSYSESNLLKDFMSCQSFDGQSNPAVSSVASVSQQGMFGAIGDLLPQTSLAGKHTMLASQLSMDMSRGHAPLSRMQSAPVPNISQMVQQPQRQAPTMMRQNSSSDTQLNKIDALLENIGYSSSERTTPHCFYGDGLQSRGSLREKSGSVNFQIGGAPPSRVPLHHYSSMGSLNQGYVQAGSSEHEFMGHQPQYLSQTYSDIPHSRMPFMQGHHSNHGNGMLHQQQQIQQQQQHFQQQQQQQLQQQQFQQQQQSSANYGHQRGSQSYIPSRSIHDPSQMMVQGQGQSGIWHSKQFDPVTSVSASIGGLGMPPQPEGSIPVNSMALSNMVPHSNMATHSNMTQQQHSNMAYSNMSPGNMAHNNMTPTSSMSHPPPSVSPHSHSTHALIQQQFSVPIPEDRPILEDDPRYKLFFHLCGLFPEEKVRIVMNQHPEVTDAREICAYIIGAT